MASKTFREVEAWKRAHEFVSDETANDMWSKIEVASTVLNAYSIAVKEKKCITDDFPGV